MFFFQHFLYFYTFFTQYGTSPKAPKLYISTLFFLFLHFYSKKRQIYNLQNTHPLKIKPKPKPTKIKSVPKSRVSQNKKSPKIQPKPKPTKNQNHNQNCTNIKSVPTSKVCRNPNKTITKTETKAIT